MAATIAKAATLLATFATSVQGQSQDFYVAPPVPEGARTKHPFEGAADVFGIKELGTKSHPFRQPAFVRLKKGLYPRTSLHLTAEDSGTALAPITYTTWTDNEGSVESSKGDSPGDSLDSPDSPAPVCLSGGMTIPASAWKPVEVPSKTTGAFVADLFALGLNSTSLGSLAAPYPVAQLELFYGGQAMPLARYPNIASNGTWEWLGFEQLVSVTNNSMTLNDSTAAYKLLGKALAEDDADLWLHGYWTWDWRDSFVQVSSLASWNSTEGSFVIKTNPLTPPWYPFKVNNRFLATNALALLDAPGEYFVSKQGLLYFISPEPEGTAPATASVSVENSVLNLDGVSHTSFQGLSIEAAQGSAVRGVGLTNVTFSSCAVGLAGGACINLEGSNVTVEGNVVTGCGGPGVSITGGDVLTLQHSGNTVSFNNISSFARVRRTYNPGVAFQGVGHYIAGNRVLHGPHAGMQGGGNDLLFEHNHLEHLCFETVDVGAFYVGRSWSQRGNVFRNNTIAGVRATERLAQQSCAQNAFYLDDQMSGWVVEGNVFADAVVGVLLGGGRRNVFRDNYFANNTLDVHFDNRGMIWQSQSCQIDCDPSLGTSCFHAELEKLHYTLPPYSTSYPDLPAIYQQSPCVPVYNVISNNRFCHAKGNGTFLQVSASTIASWQSTAENNAEHCDF